MYTFKERTICIIADIVKSVRELEKLTALTSLSELDILENDVDVKKYIDEFRELERSISDIMAAKNN